jgi:hypothetical protein
MKHIGLFSFGVTTCALVPTALHLLQAGPNQVGKLVAGDEKSIQIGDAHIDISVDRGLVDAGGKVHVTLTATADKHVRVPLAVLVYEQEGMAEGRTEAPPDRVGRDEVTLDVVSGKATKTFAFTLRGRRADGMDGTARFGHYTMLVMSPKAADELEAKRRRTSNSGDDPKGFFAAYNNAGNDDETPNPKAIARLDVSTRSPSDHLSIIAGDTARVGDDVAVKVRLRNPTRHAFQQVEIALDAQAAELSGQWRGLAPEQVTIDHNPDATFALAAHETKDVVFHVHTTANGTLGLVASAQCTGDDCYGDEGATKATFRLNDSLLDAIDILPAPDGDPKQVAAAAELAPAQPAAPVAAPPAQAKPAQVAAAKPELGK